MFMMRLGTEDGLVSLRHEEGKWREQGRALEGRDIRVVATHPHDGLLMFVGTYGAGLFRSRDGGESWEQPGEETGLEWIRAIAFKPDEPQTLFVGTEPARAFRSQDQGENWTDLGIQDLPGSDEWFLPYSPRAGAVRSLVIHPQRPELIYGGLEQGGVLKSTDGGDSWTITENGVNADVHSLSVHPDNAQLLFAATGGGTYRSRDGGERWERLIRDYTRAVWVHPQEPSRLFAGPARNVGKQGRVEESRNGGDTWRVAARGLDLPMEDMVESFVFHSRLPGALFAVLSDGSVLTTDLDPISWQALELPVDFVNCLELVEL
jgi:photosystem II stability/assembly factor-like uncharacterized protein